MLYGFARRSPDRRLEMVWRGLHRSKGDWDRQVYLAQVGDVLHEGMHLAFVHEPEYREQPADTTAA